MYVLLYDHINTVQNISVVDSNDIVLHVGGR
jgi:hypothetical protein